MRSPAAGGANAGRGDLGDGLADGGAEGDADADVAGALGDETGDEGEDSDGAEEESECGHGAEQGDLDALHGEGLRLEIAHAIEAGEGKARERRRRARAASVR